MGSAKDEAEHVGRPAAMVRCEELEPTVSSDQRIAGPAKRFGDEAARDESVGTRCVARAVVERVRQASVRRVPLCTSFFAKVVLVMGSVSSSISPLPSRPSARVSALYDLMAANATLLLVMTLSMVP